MAKMLGRLAIREFACGCCDWSRTKKAQRAIEKRQWRKEVS